ncbi:MAG: prolyl hydroxylase family protein [bacterium]
MSADVPTDNFYVAAYEPGAEQPALPSWASRQANPAELDSHYSGNVRRVAVERLPATFQLLEVLASDECQRLIDLSESLGYLPDAAVSLPRSVRHNDNVVWVVDEDTDDIIWKRIAHLLEDLPSLFDGKSPLGINARFRFYRYGPDDYFNAHTDGAWPGSRVINNELITNAYPDRFSQMSFLIFLNDDFEGGATRFLVTGADQKRPAQHGDPVIKVDVRTPVGGVLCFPHGSHPLHCVHSSEPIETGTKYIIRTDLLFEL